MRACVGGAARMRAVIFDLWDTLVDWPVGEGEVLKRRRRGARRRRPRRVRAGAGARATARRRQGRSRTSTARSACPDEHVDGHVTARHELGRRVLRLRDGARDAIAELRRRGVRIGLITVCSEEVPAAWPETELAGLFDAETFSSECGLVKPEPEIYLRTAEALGVERGRLLLRRRRRERRAGRRRARRDDAGAVRARRARAVVAAGARLARAAGRRRSRTWSRSCRADGARAQAAPRGAGARAARGDAARAAARAVRGRRAHASPTSCSRSSASARSR